MACCDTECLKFPAYIFTVLVGILGGGAIGVSVWQLATVDITDHMNMVTNFDSTTWNVSLWTLVATGAVVVVCAILGFVGIMYRHVNLLYWYAGFLWFLLAFILTAGSFLSVFHYTTQEEMKDNMLEQVKNDFVHDTYLPDLLHITWDRQQKKLKCCGVDGPADWRDSEFDLQNNWDDSNYTIVIEVPRACCYGSNLTRCFQDARLCSSANSCPSSKYVYTEGCLEKLKKPFTIRVGVMMILTFSLFSIQVFTVIFGCYLKDGLASKKNKK